MSAPKLPARANRPPPPPVPRSTKPNIGKPLPAIKRKRCLLWDWTCTDEKNGVPWAMENINFRYISSVCNWNAWIPPELKDRAPFRPMVRTEGQLEGWEWTAIAESKEPIIHFFNEPERIPIPPDKAARIWVESMVPLQAKRKQVSSPGCASDPGGEAWLDNFMSLTSAHPPDFLNLHYYGPESDGAIAYLEKMHSKYPALPVIVSEIACISRDAGQVHAFTKQLVNYMDGTDWIFEYAFFGCMPKPADEFVSPQAQLMNEDGSFTELMEKLMTEQPMERDLILVEDAGALSFTKDAPQLLVVRFKACKCLISTSIPSYPTSNLQPLANSFVSTWLLSIAGQKCITPWLKPGNGFYYP